MHQRKRVAEFQAEDMKDRMLRSLADMENLRERTSRQLADNKKFAIQVGTAVALLLRAPKFVMLNNCCTLRLICLYKLT